MKLLLIANEVKDIERISNYTDMWSYYLSLSLLKCGIEISYHSPRVTNDDEFIASVLQIAKEECVDHILALGVRFFSRLNDRVGNEITKSFRGLVCQVHDGSLLDGAPVDVNFTVRDDDWRYVDNANNRMTRHKQFNYYIGWAADRKIFYPEQINDSHVLQVFVDHSTFTDTSPDYTLNVFMSLRRLQEKISNNEIDGFKSLVVKTLTDDGIEKVDLDSFAVRPYNRTAVPLPIFSAELRRSHIFIVTHNESVGLSVLEAAHCGALVIAPKETINPCRLNCVKHTIFHGSIDWSNVVPMISPEKNSLYVLSQNWDNVAYNVVKGLITMNKRNKK